MPKRTRTSTGLSPVTQSVSRRSPYRERIRNTPTSSQNPVRSFGLGRIFCDERAPYAWAALKRSRPCFRRARSVVCPGCVVVCSMALSFSSTTGFGSSSIFNLSRSQSAFNKSFAQLASGKRINSAADDAAGLAIASGLAASITQISQSSR